MGKKAALHNLGCKVNAYETEAMQQMLSNAGYEIVPFTEYADVYVINTCSVTNIADRKSRQMLHRAKKENPDSIVVAAGCYVQTSQEEAAGDTAIDLMIGNNRKHELVELLEKYMQAKNRANAGDTDLKVNLEEVGRPGETYEELYLSRTSEHTRAFLKVQDGCNQFCSYCIIPYARGRVRSRRTEDVVAEVRALAENGYREVVLTGIHLSSFGADHGENLLQLVTKVHEVEKIMRIRLGSLEPNIITEEFAQALAGLPKVCPHFHLSLQSGCDATLKRMNRRYDTASYREKCEILRSHFEHPAITTDVIVGFPGETEEEFLQTREFLESIRFYEMHIFKYSKRRGTRAAEMKDQVPEEIKQKRSRILFDLERKMSGEFREYYVGKPARVLFEEPYSCQGERYYTGYTKEYVKLAVRTDRELENRFLSGTVTGKLDRDVYLLEEADA